jgi:hypothetical protein
LALAIANDEKKTTKRAQRGAQANGRNIYIYIYIYIYVIYIYIYTKEMADEAMRAQGRARVQKGKENSKRKSVVLYDTFPLKDV